MMKRIWLLLLTLLMSMTMSVTCLLYTSQNGAGRSRTGATGLQRGVSIKQYLEGSRVAKVDESGSMLY